VYGEGLQKNNVRKVFIDRNQNLWLALDDGIDFIAVNSAVKYITDSLLAWCKANNMYLILDLHAAPGGQGNDLNISDRNPDEPSFWESEENSERSSGRKNHFTYRRPCIGVTHYGASYGRRPALDA